MESKGVKTVPGLNSCFIKSGDINRLSSTRQYHSVLQRMMAKFQREYHPFEVWVLVKMAERFLW